MFFYFRPKKFERFKGKSVYSYIGVKFFKKYLLLTDLVIFRFGKKRQLNHRKEQLNDELKRLNWQTCRDETIHLIFIATLAAYLYSNSANLSLWKWMLIFIVNLYANIYPIFVQRYNRARYLSLLTKRSSKDDASGAA